MCVPLDQCSVRPMFHSLDKSVFDESIQNRIIHIEPSRQLSQTQPLQEEASCRRRAIYLTAELAIFVIFFLHCSHPYIFIFNTSIASVGTHERIAKIRVSKCQTLKFLWDFENRQN